MASGTEPLCAMQAWRALLRKKRCRERKMGHHTGPWQGPQPRPWAKTPARPGAQAMTKGLILCSLFPREPLVRAAKTSP